MKTNDAPEKIYITNYDIPALPKEEQLSERWHEVSTQDTDIEYTRTDAFIEKATEWLTKHAYKYYFNKERYLGTEELVEDFKISMEL